MKRNGTMRVIGRLLSGLVLATVLNGAHSVPAAAQSPVQIGAPLTGEVVLNRDSEVRIAPNENGRIVMTLEKGKPLNALGTPRGTLWTQVAIGGQPIGYVPADAIDPALMIRPLPLPSTPRPVAAGTGKPGPAIGPNTVAALAPKAAWDRGQSPQARGYVVLLDDVVPPAPPPPEKGKEKKAPPKPKPLLRGEVAGLLSAGGGEVQLIAPGGGRYTAPAAKVLGVISGYPLPGQTPLGTGTLYAARLGEYVDYAEGRRAWDVFIHGAGGEFRDRPPMVWPVFRGDSLVYQMGIGPFSAEDLDNICPQLARRGFACAIIDLARF